MEEFKRGHASQIGALTKTFAGQIETLKAESAKLQTQLANVSYNHPHHHRIGGRSHATGQSTSNVQYCMNPHLDGYDTTNNDRYIILHDRHIES
jgi:hypothetical protein